MILSENSGVSETLNAIREFTKNCKNITIDEKGITFDGEGTTAIIDSEGDISLQFKDGYTGSIDSSGILKVYKESV